MFMKKPWRFFFWTSLALVLFFPGRKLLYAQARETPNVRYPAPAQEQDTLKTVVGQVVDKGGSPLARAVVHLKNKKTVEVKTRISDAEGKYSFRGLDRDADYELHAEFEGASSPNRNVSSFDDRSEIRLDLQIDTSK